jgi:hypothetical protein
MRNLGRLRADFWLNLVLAAVLAVFGLVMHGPTYLVYIVGAGGAYLMTMWWLQSREVDHAMTAGLGVAWGWLAVVNALFMRRWPGVAIGLLVMAVWTVPHMLPPASKAGRPASATKANGQPGAPPPDDSEHAAARGAASGGKAKRRRRKG